MESNRKPATSLLAPVLLLFPGLVLARDGLNGANTSWIPTSTALALFLTLPGLSLFYAGLVRSPAWWRHRGKPARTGLPVRAGVMDSSSIPVGKFHTVQAWHGGARGVTEKLGFAMAQNLQVCHFVKDIIDKTGNEPVAAG